jgi:hypothetical protein
MRSGRAGLVLIALGTAGALTAAALPGDPAVAAPARTGAAAAHSGSWLPATPQYWPLVAGHQATRPQVLTRGVTWDSQAYQTVGGAERAQVLDVDLARPNVRLGLVEAGDKLVDPADETPSSMADRTGAVAGINGDFFDINASGQPLGMVVQDGVLEASPVASWPDELEVLTNGQVEMATETFTGTAADTTNGQTEPLAGVNRTDQSGLVAVTSFLGATPIASSVVATATQAGDSPPQAGDSPLTLTVTSVTSGVTSLPQLASGAEDLIAPAGSAAAEWLAGVSAGDSVTLTESLAPYDNLQTALSGPAYLVQNGQMAVPAAASGDNNVNYPVTGVGVTKDGKHAIFATFDGEASENTAVGLTRPQLAQWMLAHGAYNAIEFDGGGSALMVGRLPGQPRVSVLNTPSDGQERPVANGLFVYSTEGAPGPAARAVVNGGRPMTVLAGTTEPVAAYATDALGNPAADPARVSVQPPGLATADGTSLTAGRPGRGWLTVQAGRARSRVPLTVVRSAASLSVSPGQPDLQNDAPQQFTLSATAAGGAPLTLAATDAAWSVNLSSLGSVGAGGLFTAAATGAGLATVSATAGGRTATASVAVGSQSSVADPMTDVGNWAVHTTNGATASLAESTVQKANPGDAGSMDVHYTIPAATGVSQVVFSPSAGHDVAVAASPSGQVPDAIGLWIKGVGGTPGTPLADGDLTFAESWIEVNGQAETFYPTTVTYDGWQLITAAVPAGTQFPLSLDFLDFLVIKPAQPLSGDVYVADLQALYSPRPPSTPPYTAIPANPGWLRYTGSPAQFTPGGVTIADLGDAQITLDNAATGSVVTAQASQAIGALPAVAAPNVVQVNGDIAGGGTLADLQDGQQALAGFGLPYHDAVGSVETAQGKDAENQNWTSVFGPTHYSYTDGAADVIVTDSAHGGLLASDADQVPAAEQYAWLAAQLTASTSKVVVVVTSEPPYDPHPAGVSQFTDRYEAQMYETLLADYRDSHPGVHVILLDGSAAGFAEQVLGPLGQPDRGGLPNFTVAGAGAAPAAPADQGGFYSYALLHVLPDGSVQFAVQPVLSAIAVIAPQPSLPVGAAEQLSATGTTPAGDDRPALEVPVADPASHLWSSSDPRVAAVDPQTGRVVARSPGTATITVLAGGVTAAAVITVSLRTG